MKVRHGVPKKMPNTVAQNVYGKKKTPMEKALKIGKKDAARTSKLLKTGKI